MPSHSKSCVPALERCPTHNKISSFDNQFHTSSIKESVVVHKWRKHINKLVKYFIFHFLQNIRQLKINLYAPTLYLLCLEISIMEISNQPIGLNLQVLHGNTKSWTTVCVKRTKQQFNVIWGMNMRWGSLTKMNVIWLLSWKWSGLIFLSNVHFADITGSYC